MHVGGIRLEASSNAVAQTKHKQENIKKTIVGLRGVEEDVDVVVVLWVALCIYIYIYREREIDR